MIRIHNCETNEIIDREMNDVEFAQHEKDLAKRIEESAVLEANAQAKAELLTRLGITAKEAALLVG